MDTSLDPRLTAHYEVGHAVIMHELGATIRLVSIVPGVDNGGRCIPDSSVPIARRGLLWKIVGAGPSQPVSRKQYVDWQVKEAIYLDGKIVQGRFLGTSSVPYALIRQDSMAAWKIAEEATRSPIEAEQFDSLALNWVCQRLEKKWPVIRAFADALLQLDSPRSLVTMPTG